MCRCTPRIRTPFCGKPGCSWPKNPPLAVGAPIPETTVTRPKPILCLDFDGVIHSYMSGWMGAAVIPDPPVPGAFGFICRAVDHFRVAIYSSRSGQPGGIAAMQSYVWQYLLAELGSGGAADEVFNQIEWPTEKPPAFVTLDDRALCFDGTWPSIDGLRKFKPWYQAPEPSEPFPVTIDRAAGIITICGVTYDFDAFRFFGFAEIGRSIRLVQRENGVVTVEKEGA